ncbi:MULTISPECIES: hypothetical protein [Acinetobacter]|uniref:hypothetical protein n=1 Tax=Acinetobacter TaxID=469 RepID=UPI00148FEF7D|nr:MULTISPECIES: hypothetical protein [Acinetobacter]MCH7338633.1 hypothetical protein [Acinetobacter higginsii]MCI3877598.1 hypothetical protein [Acinetobacter higginsii]MDO3665538.1 hypothetical protein [Acinetobacter higginsii]NNP74770.1 hypothetical protein [Acinetobacter sp. Ac_3412]
MLLNFLNKLFRSKVLDQKPKLLSFSFNDRKITAYYDTINPVEIYYRDILTIYIIFHDTSYPIPVWNIVAEDNFIQIDNTESINFKLLINMFSNNLENFNEDSRMEIIKAMGSVSGIFHVWNRKDSDEIFSKKKII